MRKTMQLQLRVTPEEKKALRRAARAAKMGLSSWVLRAALPRASQDFADLVERLAAGRGDPSYTLAELHDWLAGLRRSEFAEAVAEEPGAALGRYWANYVAAMVEVTAHRLQASAPSWTRAILPLDAPAFMSDIHGLRLHLLTRSPPPFRRRNIFIDATVGDRV